MSGLTDRLKDAAFVTIMQGLVVVVLGVPIGYGVSFVMDFGPFEAITISAITGIFIANLLDIQEFGRVSP